MPDDQTMCITTHTDAMAEVPRRDRPFPCRRRGRTPAGDRIPEAHYADCENNQCRGCIPRSAHFGYLCPVCFGRLDSALPKLGDLIAHLRSIERPPMALGERVATSMERSILMPDTWIAADELMEAIGARVIPSTANIDTAIGLAHDAVDAWMRDRDQIINTIDGATQAVVLLKRIGLALRRWPDSDAELRPIPHMPCPACGWDHLWRQGPAKRGDDERVVCGTEGCGYSYPFLLWTAKNAPVFAEFEADMKRREKTAEKEKRDA